MNILKHKVLSRIDACHIEVENISKPSDIHGHISVSAPHICIKNLCTGWSHDSVLADELQMEIQWRLLRLCCFSYLSTTPLPWYFFDLASTKDLRLEVEQPL